MNKLQQTLLNLVKENGGASFTEIERLPGASGNFGIDMIGRNVEVWRGLSEEAANALANLRELGLVHFRPCSPLIYVADGAVTKLPLVRSAQAYARGYRHPHWLPMTVEPGPHPNTKT